MGTGDLTITGTLAGSATNLATSELTAGADIILLNGATMSASEVTLSAPSSSLNTEGAVTLSGSYTGSNSLPNLTVLSGTTSFDAVAITIAGATEVQGTLGCLSTCAGLKDFGGTLIWIALPILALIFLVDILWLRQQFRPVVAASLAASAIGRCPAWQVAIRTNESLVDVSPSIVMRLNDSSAASRTSDWV